MVRIKLIGLMAHLAGRNSMEVNIEGKIQVGKLLSELIPEFEKVPRKIILVNGRRVSEDYEVSSEDEITVMHSISGGRSLYLPTPLFLLGRGLELDYLYTLFNECEREFKELRGSEEEKYYALSQALLNLRLEKEKYEIALKAYREISERVRGKVLIFSSGIGLLPYLVLRRGRASYLRAIMSDNGVQEIVKQVFLRMGLPDPFQELQKREKFDFVVLSKYLSEIKSLEREMTRIFRYLSDTGKILVFDEESSGVFDDLEELALQNGMRSRTIMREKAKMYSRTETYRLVEYYFLEAKKGRYVKTGIFLIKP